MIEPERLAAFMSLLEKPYLRGGLLGEPYDPEDGCLKFVMQALSLIGIKVSGDLRDDGRNWQCIWDKDKTPEALKLNPPRLGDVAVFQGLPFSKFHVAMMLDYRRAIQSSVITGGVGRIDVIGGEWFWALRSIYRHKSLLDS